MNKDWIPRARQATWLTVALPLWLGMCGADAAPPGADAVDGVVIWDAERLVALRQNHDQADGPVADALARVRRNADVALERGPYSVVGHGEPPPSGDDHDYISFANYWWPDPDKPDGKPFIRRDGVTNRRQVAKGDRELINLLADDVESLALAYFFFGDQRYAEHACVLLEAWFLDEATRMNPNLRFAQNVPGRHDGRGAGIIDTRAFATLLDGVALLKTAPSYTAELDAALHAWFDDFLNWLLVSSAGCEERKAENNHGSWYAAQSSRIALFVDRPIVAVKILKEVCTERLPKQFRPDGSQPEELARTMGLHYSLFNLTALGVAARVGDRVAVDVWNAGDGQSAILAGLQYVRPYLAGEQAWPHQQIRRVEINSSTALFFRQASRAFGDPTWLTLIPRMPHRDIDYDYSALVTPPAAMSVAEVGRAPTPDDLPQATPAAIRKLLPNDWTGAATIESLDPRDDYLQEAARGMQRGGAWDATSGERFPLVRITGNVRWNDIVSQVDDADLVMQTGSTTVLRAPLLVAPGATLLIEAADVRLSSQRGALLLNAGRLFVIDAEITAWDERAEKPSDLPDPERFRSYIASLIRSETYLADSVFVNLGYHSPTCYGISLSSEPEREQPERQRDWPTGILAGNQFRGLYYGFYSFEARNVYIVDNHYLRCILYGIDPHDRSTQFVIARNLTERTQIKHGIIGSRRISQSRIVENTSRNNAGSGIMLDRACTNNIVQDNNVYGNGQGIAVYESSHNDLRGNLVLRNKLSGVRVRNSVAIEAVDNTVVANGGFGFELASRRLDDHEQRAARGDLYDIGLEASVIDNVVTGNAGGAIKGVGVDRLRLGPLFRVVDAALVERRTSIADLTLKTSADLTFGSELKAHANLLRRAFEPNAEVIDFRGSD
ncbi:MAG: alginate lyase family protein [Planctomycetales bacterium]|nr:alginate lyase family protein [Planctomycetales bacterium]